MSVGVVTHENSHREVNSFPPFSQTHGLLEGRQEAESTDSDVCLIKSQAN